MTPGTSPLPLGAASYSGAGAELFLQPPSHSRWRHSRRAVLRLRSAVSARTSLLLRSLAAVYLAAFGALTMTAWSGAGTAGNGLLGGLLSGLGQAHVAFLMLAGAGMALVTLQSGKVRREASEPAPVPATGQLTGLGDLLAQMSHELRTPLNAVIGFSDVMRHELHGPLGNARYQEYAAHISESGGRMLKSSQDALAVAEAMTVLLARAPELRRERVVAGTIVREAWRAAGPSDLQLDIITCNTCDITCERRATTQALEHLMREAVSHAADGGGVQVIGGRRASERTLRIRAGVVGVGAAAEPGTASDSKSADYPRPGCSLNLLLARLLLEAQDARLEIGADADGGWLAEITFRKPRAS